MKVIFVPAYVFLATLCAQAASAQVTINPAALVQLAGIPAPPPPHAPEPVKRAVFVHKHIARPAAPAAAKIIPVVAKPAPSLTAAAPPPPPAKPLLPITLTFAPGSVTLPAGAAAALQPYCATNRQVAIDAHAPGDPTDPSVAMRLSLSRALAVRDALTACGVPSSRILPRADGATPAADEDRAVIGIAGAK